MGSHAIVIGSTGQIGRASITAFIQDGWTVTAVHRGSVAHPPGWSEHAVVEVVADREEPDALRDIVARTGGADVIVDTIAYDDGHARQLLEIANDVRSAVVISSASVYAYHDGRTLDEATGVDDFPRFGGPIPEDHATVAPGASTYSTRKVLLERTLLDDGTLPTTILRPCAVHGAGSSSPREVWPLLRALDRRPQIPVTFRGASRFHTTSAPNLAEVIRLAAESPAARVLNVGDPQPPDVAEIVRAVCATADHQPTLVKLDGPAGAAGVGRTPWSAPLPFVVDMTAAERDLGYRAAATYADAVVDTCAWLREQLARRPWRTAFPLLAKYYGDRMDDYDAEDSVLRGE